MNGVDRVERRRSLKDRLACKGMHCCGPTWGFRPSTISVRDDEDEEVGLQEEQQQGVIEVGQITPANFADQNCVSQIPATASMNLATALAAERHYRSAQDSDGTGSPEEPTENLPSIVAGGTTPGTPLRVSLMRLLEETTDGADGEEETTEKGGGSVGTSNDSVCCVCMGRKKGAAFVPCGHTFCRVCSRELWLNRGSCPLCNNPILQILDIF